MRFPFMAPPTSSALKTVSGNPSILNLLPSFISLLSTATVPHLAFLPDAVMPYHLFDGSLSQHFLHEQYAVAVKTSACRLFTETMLNRDIINTTTKDNTFFLLIFISFHLTNLSTPYGIYNYKYYHSGRYLN